MMAGEPDSRCMLRPGRSTKSGLAEVLPPTHPLGKPDSIPPPRFAFSMLPWMSHEIGAGVATWTAHVPLAAKMFATSFMPATPDPDGPEPLPPMTIPAFPLFTETL